MDQHDLTRMLMDLFADHRKKLISPTCNIVFRGGAFLIGSPEDDEAGDLIIVPPSLVNMDSPTGSYIQGCIEKCWPLIKEKIQ